MKLDLLDILKVFKTATEMDHLFVSYGHLRFLEEFGDLSLNKTYTYRNKDYFYSEAWANGGYSKNKIPVDYPLIVTFCNDYQLNRNEIYYTFQLYACMTEDPQLRTWEEDTLLLEQGLRRIIHRTGLFVYDTDGNDWKHESQATSPTVNLRSRMKNINTLICERGYAQTNRKLITTGCSLSFVGCYPF